MQPRRHSLAIRNTPDSRETHELVFYDWGNVDAATTVICVHGLTRNAKDFELIAPALAATGRRVLSLSMIGRGESEWVADPMLYSYETYVKDCLAVLDNFHLRTVEWIGTSMGGIIGMLIAAHQPDRIKKLVMNDIGMFISKESLGRIQDYVQTMPQSFTSREEADRYLQVIYKPFGITDPNQWQAFVDNSLITKADGVLRYACDPAIAEPMRIASKDFTEVQDVNLVQFWEQVRIPTFILHGAESDVLSADTVRAMKISNPRAESVTLQGIGHAPSLMNAHQIRLVSNWLSGNNASMLASGL